MWLSLNERQKYTKKSEKSETSEEKFNIYAERKAAPITHYDTEMGIHAE
jgi:hypothetical protein